MKDSGICGRDLGSFQTPQCSWLFKRMLKRAKLRCVVCREESRSVPDTSSPVRTRAAPNLQAPHDLGGQVQSWGEEWPGGRGEVLPHPSPEIRPSSPSRVRSPWVV